MFILFLIQYREGAVYFQRVIDLPQMRLLVADYDNALVSLTVLIQIAHENAKVQKDGLDVAQSHFRNGATLNWMLHRRAWNCQRRPH